MDVANLSIIMRHKPRIAFLSWTKSMVIKCTDEPAGLVWAARGAVGSLWWGSRRLQLWFWWAKGKEGSSDGGRNLSWVAVGECRASPHQGSVQCWRFSTLLHPWQLPVPLLLHPTGSPLSCHPTPGTLLSRAGSLILIKKDTARKLSSEFNWPYFTVCQEEFIKLPDQTGADERMGNQCCFNKRFAFEEESITLSGTN